MKNRPFLLSWESKEYFMEQKNYGYAFDYHYYIIQYNSVHQWQYRQIIIICCNYPIIALHLPKSFGWLITPQ
jgi:hypothetical protein